MPSRRLIPRVLLCLMLGLVTAVCVAWGFATVSIAPAARKYVRSEGNPFHGVEYYTSGASGARRCVLAGPQLTRDGLMSIPRSAQEVADWACERADELARARVFPEWWGQPPDQAHLPAASLWAGSIQDARGWPFLALSCEWPIAVGTASPPPPARSRYGDLQRVRGGLPLSPSDSWWGYASDEVRALPFRPIWRGLVANTALFALAWLVGIPLIGQTVRALRARSRRHRNQCPNCAYPRAGLDPTSPCPECGQPPRA